MKYILVALFTMLTSLPVFAAEAAPSIFGQWKTFDEKTGAPKGLVEIKQVGDEIKGNLLETYSDPTKTTCEKCEDDKKGKPLKGLEIIWGVKETDKDEWGKGKILDPENGKTYRVKFALEDGGKKLRVRGYIGISLLGRTQVWQRK